jgi:membrane protease YdiL (CAAX protease family)
MLLVADLLMKSGPFDDAMGWLAAIVIALAFGYLHWEDEPSNKW